MKSIAFIFNNSPYGISSGKEGLDLILGFSAITNNISIFFIGDGVFNLMKNQKPKKIFLHNYIKSFGILSLYDVKKCYICHDSLLQRNLKKESLILYDKIFSFDVKIISFIQISTILDKFNYIFNF